MKKAISLFIMFNMILSMVIVPQQTARATTAYTTNQQADIDDTWSRVVTDAASDAKKWTFVPGKTGSPGIYTSYEPTEW